MLFKNIKFIVYSMKYISNFERPLKLALTTLLATAAVVPQPAYGSEKRVLATYFIGFVNCSHVSDDRDEIRRTVEQNIASISIPEIEKKGYTVNESGLVVYQFSIKSQIDSERKKEIHGVIRRNLCP